MVARKSATSASERIRNRSASALACRWACSICREWSSSKRCWVILVCLEWGSVIDQPQSIRRWILPQFIIVAPSELLHLFDMLLISRFMLGFQIPIATQMLALAITVTVTGELLCSRAE